LQGAQNVEGFVIYFALWLGTAGAGLARDTMNQDDGQKTYGSQKPIQLTGVISARGRTLVGDKDGKNWNIFSPDPIKGHEGQHVLLIAIENCFTHSELSKCTSRERKIRDPEVELTT
jgi:hypothetical protein